MKIGYLVKRGWKQKRDLLNSRFTRLTVKQDLGVGSCGHAQWLCLCDCGNFRVVKSDCLLGGQTKSCGCYSRDQKALKRTTHGRYGTKTYVAWSGIQQRCNNPKSKFYENYGARGIKVCSRWKKFENFYADMGDPDPDQSLDRIDVNDDYGPSNCRWASRVTQANNRRNNFKIQWQGKEKSLAEWSRVVGIKSGAIRRRIVDLKWSTKDAMTIPLGVAR